MEEYEIIIKEPGKKYELKIIPEIPFVRILAIEYTDNSKPIGIVYGNLNFVRESERGSLYTEGLVDREPPFVVKSLKGINRGYILYHENEKLEKPIRIIYQNQNIRGLLEPSRSFEVAFSLNKNRRMFFSGKFGSGKTTFLNYFFEKNSDKYNVFRINPVHYSIASNQDIFRYIKADLLYQLLVRIPLTTQEERKQSLTDYLGWELYNRTFVKNIGQYAGLVSSLGKVIPYEQAQVFFGTLHILIGLSKNAIKKYCEGDQEESEKDQIVDFFSELEQQEGGLLEYNSITSIIEFYLNVAKEDEGKENVLLIDDLDRIDPDHIFRILNIISAHFDSAVHSGLERDKFGFDKLIIVADHDNIEGIYKHRFGENVDFDGYIKKLSGSLPYEFSNKEALLEIIGDILKEYDKDPRAKLFSDDLWEVLILLKEINQISMRELVKLSQMDFQDSIEEIVSKSNDNTNMADVLIHFLLKVWSAKSLRKKFEAIKDRKIEITFNRTSFCRILPGLGKLCQEKKNGDDIFEVTFKSGKVLYYSRVNHDSRILFFAELLGARESPVAFVEGEDNVVEKHELGWGHYAEIFIQQIDQYKKQNN